MLECNSKYKLKYDPNKHYTYESLRKFWKKVEAARYFNGCFLRKSARTQILEKSVRYQLDGILIQIDHMIYNLMSESIQSSGWNDDMPYYLIEIPGNPNKYYKITNLREVYNNTAINNYGTGTKYDILLKTEKDINIFFKKLLAYLKTNEVNDINGIELLKNERTNELLKNQVMSAPGIMQHYKKYMRGIMTLQSPDSYAKLLYKRTKAIKLNLLF